MSNVFEIFETLGGYKTEWFLIKTCFWVFWLNSVFIQFMEPHCAELCLRPVSYLFFRHLDIRNSAWTDQKGLIRHVWLYVSMMNRYLQIWLFAESLSPSEQWKNHFIDLKKKIYSFSCSVSGKKNDQDCLWIYWCAISKRLEFAIIYRYDIV